MDLFGRRTRRENRELTTGLATTRENLRAARGHREVVENDRDVWQRRATEWAARTTDAEVQLRAERRENADLRERLRRQEDIIHRLQAANEKHYAELQDRAGVCAPEPRAVAAA